MARFVFVKVQVTVSPAAALNVADFEGTLPVLSESLQVTEVRSQPLGTVSVEV